MPIRVTTSTPAAAASSPSRETAREFQPPESEKDQVIEEVSAGLVECLLETMCPVDVISSLLDAIFPLREMRAFRDRVMRNSAAGRRYGKMLSENAIELIGLAHRNRQIRSAAETMLRTAGRLTKKQGERIAADDLKAVEQALAIFQKYGSKKLQVSIATAARDMAKLEGLSLQDAFVAIDKRPRAGKKPAPKKPAS